MLYTRIFWATLGAILATVLWLVSSAGQGPGGHDARPSPTWHAQVFSPAATPLTPTACADPAPASAPASEPAAAAPCLPGPLLLPGMNVSRQVGPVLFMLWVDSTQARVEAQVSMGNAGLTGLNMTADAPTAAFDLASDGQRVRGSLGAFFCAPPNASHLLADFNIEGLHDAPAQAYRGDLIRWQSPTSSVIARYRQPVLPDLQVTVELLDPYTPGSNNALTAQVSFYYASDLIDRYSLIATAGPVTLRQSSVGPVRILGGALAFRPATEEQQGQLSLDGTFQSGQNPPNHYVGSIADWSWIRGRADNCRG